ncbi:MAG: hypothetical protein ACTHQQ_14680 [Solirubrobacteraceae bacterium]
MRELVATPRFSSPLRAVPVALIAALAFTAMLVAGARAANASRGMNVTLGAVSTSEDGSCSVTFDVSWRPMPEQDRVEVQAIDETRKPEALVCLGGVAHRSRRSGRNSPPV